jgi:hypothetical protein
MSGWTSPSTMKVGETLHPAIALDPPDDVVGRGIEVRPAAMAVEFEFLPMRGHRRHNGFTAAFPASRVEAARMQRTITPEYMCQGCDCRDLDGDAVLAGLVEQVFEFAESPDGKWAGRFQEHLENARPVAPDKGISARYAFMRSFPYPVQFAVKARSGVGAGS